MAPPPSDSELKEQKEGCEQQSHTSETNPMILATVLRLL